MFTATRVEMILLILNGYWQKLWKNKKAFQLGANGSLDHHICLMLNKYELVLGDRNCTVSLKLKKFGRVSVDSCTRRSKLSKFEHVQRSACFPEYLTFFTWAWTNLEFRWHRKWSLNRQFQGKSMKNYRAHSPQNLALTKIVQKISKTSTLLGGWKVKALYREEPRPYTVGVGRAGPGNSLLCRRNDRQTNTTENIASPQLLCLAVTIGSRACSVPGC